jgi:5,10-methenyltetrahydrofolate synthetase
MTPPTPRPPLFSLASLQMSTDKNSLRRQLQAERQSLIDRHQRAMHLQEVLRVWLAQREDEALGAYWPIKGEFDALPALYRWAEASDSRLIGLPVVDVVSRQLRFHAWYPGCEMENDAYGIPKPKGTLAFTPSLLLVPCVGYGPAGIRLGYGGGFYDRTLATVAPRPYTVGLAYSHGYVPWMQGEAHDVPLDAILTEEGVAWEKSA